MQKINDKNKNTSGLPLEYFTFDFSSIPSDAIITDVSVKCYGAKESGDKTVTVVASTASPYKFARTVMTAIDAENASKDDFTLIDTLCEKSGVAIPQAIEDIRSAAVLHDIVCATEEMPAEVKKFLGL